MTVLFFCRAVFVKCFIFSSEQDLLDLIPGSYLGRLFPKASNLKDLVVHAYKVNSFTFSFTPLSLGPLKDNMIRRAEGPKHVRALTFGLTGKAPAVVPESVPACIGREE